MTSVDSRFSQVLDLYAARQRETLATMIEDTMNEDGKLSPIERLLVVGFLLADSYGSYALPLAVTAPGCGCLTPVEIPSIGRIHHQHPVKIGRSTYRLDFAILGALDVKVAVECDGHEFHEKTKEQASKDKARERALVSAGWLVMRFAGSEIWRDPEGCADQVQLAYIAEWERRHLSRSAGGGAA